MTSSRTSSTWWLLEATGQAAHCDNPAWEGQRQLPRSVLRHTCASIMLEAGESVVTVARWLGHSSPAITLGYYAHFMPEAGGWKQGADGH
ncbi:tyrosine-type recombinase/integrase [Streptomyces sp. NPDC054834]